MKSKLFAALILILSAASMPLARAGDKIESPVSRARAKEMTASNYKPGALQHVVVFKFKNDVTEGQIEQTKIRFLELQKKCVRKGHPYIKSLQAGRANSYEGADQGKQIGFIVTFASEGDRNFYVGQPLIDAQDAAYYDKAHVEFKNFVGPLLATPVVPEGVFVFDFAVTR